MPKWRFAPCLLVNNNLWRKLVSSSELVSSSSSSSSKLLLFHSLSQTLRQDITRLWSNHDKLGYVPILMLKSSKLVFCSGKQRRTYFPPFLTENDDKLQIIKNTHWQRQVNPLITINIFIVPLQSTKIFTNKTIGQPHPHKETTKRVCW